jgi:L-cysteine:1D-myo-inositol 2-amino-2-deoxy-alpha-D-glucopyranoside ligase
VTLRLYDTAKRAVVPFEPPHTVRMYVCGITPYDSTHLGHAATYLTYDILTRRLEDLGHEVRMVRNITDVDDSILPKARELGVPYLELAAAEVARFHGDMAALEMRPPLAEPRATESIEEIIELVARLLESGHAYLTHGTAYFDVSTFPDYGELSHYSEEQMVRLARARGGNPDDPHRRQPLDFVLWQPSLADEPAWRAPFGIGRPGWHIECSAMAMHEHGPTLDLHGGGTDLIFPHHECEIAQSEALTGEPFVKHWLHSAMVNYEGEKMSKSLGNLVFVSDLLKTADARAIRLALMRHQYRHGFEWYDTDLDEGAALLHRLLAAADRESGADPRPYAVRVRDAIDDDLDTPRALDALDDLASAILSSNARPESATEGEAAREVLCELGQLVGVDLKRPVGVR